MQLLTTSNPKTQKGVKLGYLTAIQHFAPSKLSGIDVCSHATPECIRFCLNKAGRGGIFPKGETTNKIQQARIARTRFFYEDRGAYTEKLFREIWSHQRKADKLGLEPAVRLNGTSDLDWVSLMPELFLTFRRVQFYDYTKNPDIYKHYYSFGEPSNYYLTFSLSERNLQDAERFVANGGNSAVVFDHVPLVWRGVPVIDGDGSDLRFLDKPGRWVGLKAKGKLRKSNSPFKIGPKLMEAGA